MEEWKKNRQLLKPKDQLELSDVELKEIIARVLTTTNPQQPDNLVQFDYATNTFVSIPPPGNMVVVLDLKGTYIHKETEEARKQMIEQGIDREYSVCKIVFSIIFYIIIIIYKRDPAFSLKIYVLYVYGFVTSLLFTNTCWSTSAQLYF